MYKKMLVIILFIVTFIFINFKFKITNYVTLNILNRNNIFNSVIDDSTLEKIIDKKEFLYKNKKYIVKECFPLNIVIRDEENKVFTEKYKRKFE